mgnify:CR=1 FL=1
MRKMLKKTVTAIGIGAFLLALQPFTTRRAMKNGRKNTGKMEENFLPCPVRSIMIFQSCRILLI